MSAYRAPLEEIRFALYEVAGLDQVAKLPGFEEATRDTVDAILDEAAKFATEVLDPLNASGDREGSTWRDGAVTTPSGFKAAYTRFAENGWNGLTKDPAHGGQGLPQLVATAVEEMWHGANMAFALCPMLTQGAIDALELVGSERLQSTFLDKMVSGVWTGTMNLTEAQAGSDLAAVRTRAVPQDDGSFRLHGQKIFITYGEQDYTDNIIHLVLARTPTAPEGVKGISLFVVPKVLVKADGSLGARNDVHCVSIEHKLGIHASPTAVLAYGDRGGAVGYLVGEENRGLEYMFIMMNLARFSVGIQGLGIAERAYQRARAYARDRVQGRAPGQEKAGQKATILQHPDVRRMLLTMKAQTEAMRAVAYVTGAAIDNARRHPDAEARKQHQAFGDLMIPIVKGWSTEVAQEVAYLGVQVHGGMGFIEETGAAQDYRDARITTIYEGTTAIQANDLIGRKTAKDGGKVARAVGADIGRVAAELAASDDADLKRIGGELAAANAALADPLELVGPCFCERALDGSHLRNRSAERTALVARDLAADQVVR
ncbi:MAG TPA: acyl-CoA dehydrogenase family protein, partial [Casimicrobiaceae bacterium]|nr:acyl-CoA dehydrogenase family protein [Casimicrobiaceae bacterium]